MVEVMKEQVNNRNSIPIVGYLTRHYPKVSLQGDIISPLQKEYDFFVTDPRSGLAVPLNAEHLNDIGVWMSNFAYDRIYHKIADVIGNPAYSYGMGYESMIYHRQLRFFGPLLGVQGIVALVPKENEKWNRTKKVIILDNSPGHFLIGYQHLKSLDDIELLVSELAKYYHRGLGDGTAEVAGQVGDSIKSFLRDGKEYPFIGKPDPNEGVYFEYEGTYGRDSKGNYKPDTRLERMISYYIVGQLPYVKKRVNNSRAGEIHAKEAAIRERIQKEKLEIANQGFQMFLSGKTSEYILKGNKPPVGLEEMVDSILFSDIRDFTTISGKIGNSAVSRLLTEYYEAIDPVIKWNGGEIDKHVGDEVMAYFHSPFAAVKSSVEMRNALRGFNDDIASNPYYREKGLIFMRAGIGIATGEVLEGITGSSVKLDETVIGERVNAGSRIESLTKEFNVSTIVDDKTYEMLEREGNLLNIETSLDPVDALGSGKILARKLGRTLPKGMLVPITLYEIMNSYSPQILERRIRNHELYNKALELSNPKSNNPVEVIKSLKKANEMFLKITYDYPRGVGFRPEGMPENPGGDYVCDRYIQINKDYIDRINRDDVSFLKSPDPFVIVFNHK